MGYRRLFIMRKDLHMSAGKLLAQVGHCAEAYWTRLLLNSLERTEGGKCIFGPAIKEDMFSGYIKGTYTKIICEAKNKSHLLKARTKAESLGLTDGEDFGLIYDKCFTELASEEADGTTLTGIWFGPLPDEIAHEISRKYQLYRQNN